MKFALAIHETRGDINPASPSSLSFCAEATNYGGLAANVAEHYDIPLAARHTFPSRASGHLLPILPSPLSAPQ